MSDKQAGAKPVPTAIDFGGPAEPALASEAAAEPGEKPELLTAEPSESPELLTAETDEKPELLTAESLGRYLAAETSLREESEQRTSAVLARYLKLTLAMACLNMVVAAVSVAALLRQRDRAQTVVVTQPPVAAAPATPAAPPAPPAPAPVVVEPVAPPAEPPAPPAPTPAVSRPARVPLLGPLPPTPSHTPAPRPARVASKPLPSAPAPVAFAGTPNDEDSGHHAVERW